MWEVSLILRNSLSPRRADRSKKLVCIPGLLRCLIPLFLGRSCIIRQGLGFRRGVNLPAEKENEKSTPVMNLKHG
ncbi:hypothetical protein JMJ77_0011909 [Colletotrichum scovillei]|uniref:Uncharacterized protein n=1 Tax=Colletotrichum scovillei TaxID=1209932 RepID=A0A9P7QXN7_9PEZI|nr:hypothetical protein JMJ77_0011909 [Colletotrichum scovillei]KAG7046194.1 hypothetical protein JMJ78_0011260 [Colletotrichum scovillei]KAG7063541.1 hypothetical protein JMJ76_0006004 [Colletotrichum scovillei]